MTILIGINCSDGAVMASDSGASDSFMMYPTQKVFVHNDTCLVSIAGNPQLGHMIMPTVAQVLQTQGVSDQHQMMLFMTSNVRPLLTQELQVATQMNRNINSVATSLICASVINGVPSVFQIDPYGSCLACSTPPIVWMGSGASLAAPFLCFIERVLWGKKMPTVADAKLAAYWAIDHTLKLASGHVAPPIQISVIENSANGWIARSLSELELEETAGQVVDLEKYIAGYGSQPASTDPMPVIE